MKKKKREGRAAIEYTRIPLAQALAAERERCAKIADEGIRFTVNVARSIAAEIRAQSPIQGPQGDARSQLEWLPRSPLPGSEGMDERLLWQTLYALFMYARYGRVPWKTADGLEKNLEEMGWPKAGAARKRK